MRISLLGGAEYNVRQLGRAVIGSDRRRQPVWRCPALRLRDGAALFQVAESMDWERIRVYRGAIRIRSRGAPFALLVREDGADRCA